MINLRHNYSTAYKTNTHAVNAGLRYIHNVYRNYIRYCLRIYIRLSYRHYIRYFYHFIYDYHIVATYGIAYEFTYGCHFVINTCRRRKGYSAFKRCRSHRSDDIATLYRLANDDSCVEQHLYRDKLHRWGFNYERQCCLFAFDALFVRLPGRHEVFPCVDYRDRMHGLLMFLHRILFTALTALVRKQKHRRILDRRLAAVSARKFFCQGVTTRSQRSIFTDVGMTAADKVTLIMLLSNVIGPIPDAILPARIHVPLASAVAHAQLMLLAVRGKRSYTKTELEQIFDRGFISFFGAMETVNMQVHEAAVREYNRKVAKGKRPDKKPKQFKKMTRQAGSPVRSLPFCL